MSTGQSVAAVQNRLVLCRLLLRWDGGGPDDASARLAHRQHAADVEARRRKHRLERLPREVPDIVLPALGGGQERAGRTQCRGGRGASEYTPDERASRSTLVASRARPLTTAPPPVAELVGDQEARRYGAPLISSADPARTPNGAASPRRRHPLVMIPAPAPRADPGQRARHIRAAPARGRRSTLSCGFARTASPPHRAATPSPAAPRDPCSGSTAPARDRTGSATCHKRTVASFGSVAGRRPPRGVRHRGDGVPVSEQGRAEQPCAVRVVYVPQPRVVLPAGGRRTCVRRERHDAHSAVAAGTGSPRGTGRSARTPSGSAAAIARAYRATSTNTYGLGLGDRCVSTSTSAVRDASPRCRTGGESCRLGLGISAPATSAVPSG